MRYFTENIQRLILSGTFAVAVILPSIANAADLRIFTSIPYFNAGDFFKVSVIVDDNTTPVNAFSGKITFPADQLEFSSMEISNSIVSFWVKEPEYDEIHNVISFEGVVLDQYGFREQRGELFSVVFRSLKEGEPGISFISGSILAHDGNGTNVLDNLRSSNVQIVARDSCLGSPEECEGVASVAVYGKTAPNTVQSAPVGVFTLYQVIVIWVLSIVSIFVGGFIMYVVANKLHPGTLPRTYKEAAKEVLGLSLDVHPKRILSSIRVSRSFVYPIALAPIIVFLVSYVTFVMFENIDNLFFSSIYNLPIMYFFGLFLFHFIFYVIILFVIYKIFSKKRFLGAGFFSGAIFGGILIFILIFLGYDQYREIGYANNSSGINVISELTIKDQYLTLRTDVLALFT